MRNSRPSSIAVRGVLGLLLLTTALPAVAFSAEPVPAPDSVQSALPGSFAPLIARVKPAVVNISTTELEDAANRKQLPQMPEFPPGSPFGQFFRFFNAPNLQERHGGPLTALGSGFIIDPAGYIVTNNHVIRNGTKIEVTLQDGTTLQAKVIGHDDLTDLALLKVSADHPLPSVSWGTSDKAEVGDWVVSVGNPFGLGGTVTAGILSARGRDIHEGPYDDFLQIDAPINQGNSGGPTFNAQGQVIGINTAIFSPNGGGSVGIGFAIPSDLARPVIAELQKSGKVTRGWMGVAVQNIRPETEDALGVKSTNGAVVASVNADGPAAHAGLKPGDVITSFAGQPIQRIHDLTTAVANTAPGQSIPVVLSRNGQNVTTTVTVSQLQAPDKNEETTAANGEPPRLGLQLESVASAREQGVDVPTGMHGVVVVGVQPGSPAEQSGLQPGDVIQQVNHKTVSSPRQIQEEVKAAHQLGKKSVAIDINRDGQDQFVAVGLEQGGQS